MYCRSKDISYLYSTSIFQELRWWLPSGSCHPLLSTTPQFLLWQEGRLWPLPLFRHVTVLKCEGFVNAAILLWQGFYLTDPSCQHILLWSHQCCPQHSCGQLYLFPPTIDILTFLGGDFVPGNPIFCFLKGYFTCHKHIIMVIQWFIIIRW